MSYEIFIGSDNTLAVQTTWLIQKCLISKTIKIIEHKLSTPDGACLSNIPLGPNINDACLFQEASLSASWVLQWEENVIHGGIHSSLILGSLGLCLLSEAASFSVQLS